MSALDGASDLINSIDEAVGDFNKFKETMPDWIKYRSDLAIMPRMQQRDERREARMLEGASRDFEPSTRDKLLGQMASLEQLLTA